MSVQVLVISGSMGTGKTTVLGEASDILSSFNIAHGTLDQEWKTSPLRMMTAV